jgi:hypothetical protein
MRMTETQLAALTGTPAAKKSRSRRNMGPSEHDLQTALFNKIRANVRTIPELASCIAVPNGFYVPGKPSTGARIKKKFVDEGLTPGVPDILCLVPRNGHGALAIEMKIPTGYLDPEQKVWRDRLKSSGYRWELCRSVEEAWLVIMDYLSSEVSE